MSGVEVLLAVVLGLVVNEFTEVSPWLARKLVGWSAQLRYGDSARREIRAEELAAVVNDRPGNLFKLGTGIRFVTSALVVRVRRFVSREGEQGADDLLSIGPVLPADPSNLVSQYLFPTERFRGEWRRHWIHPAKSLFVITLYGVLGVWATILRIKPKYVPWFVAAIVLGSLLFAAYRLLGWYFARFVITNKRLMSAEGVIVRKVAMMPLIRVTDMRYTQGLLGRVLNYGTFQLESAGRRNAINRIVHLPNPSDLYLRVVEEMYEPDAVEARLTNGLEEEPAPWFEEIELLPLYEPDGAPDFDETELAPLPPREPSRPRPSVPRPPSDPAELHRVISREVRVVSQHLKRLVVALEQLAASGVEVPPPRPGDDELPFFEPGPRPTDEELDRPVGRA